MEISRQRLPDVERAPDGVSRKVGVGPVLAAILACHASLLGAVCLMRCLPLKGALFVPNRQGPASRRPWIVKIVDDEQTRFRG